MTSFNSLHDAVLGTRTDIKVVRGMVIHKEEELMATINLDGKAPEGSFERVKLKDLSRHEAELADAKIVPGRDFETGNPINRLLITWKIDNTEVPMWTNPKVSKGSGNYSNSKLYDVLKALNKLDDFAKKYEGKDEISDEELAQYFASLKGTKAVVEISNARKDTDDEYSTVSKVIEPA